MKNPGYILLFIFLATGVLQLNAQTDRIPVKLTKEQVNSMRLNIVDAIKQNDFNKAEAYADSLWQLNPARKKYILLKEYLLVKLIVGNYISVIAFFPGKSEYLFKDSKYDDIFRDLQTEASLRFETIYNDIINHSDQYTVFILRKALYQLLANYKDDKQASKNSYQNENTNYIYAYQNSDLQKRLNHANNTRESNTKKLPFKIEIGTMYKYGFFGGELNDIYSHFQIFKPLFVGFHYKKIYCDFGTSFLGTMGEYSRGIVQGIEVEGKFYGRAEEFYYVSIGWELFTGERLCINATASYSYFADDSYTRKVRMFERIGNLNREPDGQYGGNGFDCFGPGIFIDYKFWTFNKRSDNGLALRLRYNSFFWTSNYDFDEDGPIHELSIGLLVLLFDN